MASEPLVVEFVNSSLTKDRTEAPCIESIVLATGPQLGLILSPGDPWQCLETFLCPSWADGYWHLVGGGLGYAEHPAVHKTTSPQMPEPLGLPDPGSHTTQGWFPISIQARSFLRTFQEILMFSQV